MALNLSVRSRAEMLQNILNRTQLRYTKRNSSFFLVAAQQVGAQAHLY